MLYFIKIYFIDQYNPFGNGCYRYDYDRYVSSGWRSCLDCIDGYYATTIDSNPWEDLCYDGSESNCMISDASNKCNTCYLGYTEYVY